MSKIFFDDVSGVWYSRWRDAKAAREALFGKPRHADLTLPTLRRLQVADDVVIHLQPNGRGFCLAKGSFDHYKIGQLVLLDDEPFRVFRCRQPGRLLLVNPDRKFVVRLDNPAIISKRLHTTREQHRAERAKNRRRRDSLRMMFLGKKCREKLGKSLAGRVVNLQKAAGRDVPYQVVLILTNRFLHSDRYAHAIENYLETDEHQLASFLQLPANDFVTRNWAPATQEELEQRRIEILQKAKADMDEVIAKNARIDQLGAAFEKHAAAVSQRRLDKIALSMLPRMVDSK